jgi:hypothetical protein
MVSSWLLLQLSQAIKEYDEHNLREALVIEDEPLTSLEMAGDQMNQVTAEDEDIARDFLENADEPTNLGDFVCAICDDGGGHLLV